MFKDVPFCRPINSDELGKFTFKRGSTKINKSKCIIEKDAKLLHLLM
jgi:hypothetical protein